MIECLGLMGNLSIENMDWERLMKEYNLIPWLRSHITQGELCYSSIRVKLLTFLFVIGRSEDDLLLEIVVLLGTAAMDEACANLFCKAEVLQDLIELLKGKLYNTNL